MAKAIKHISEYTPLEEYNLVEAEYIDEIDSFAMRLNHKKSGARLLLLSNDNPYKYFNITFMTPCENSSGIPHILEHCVLEGSDKYPLGSVDDMADRLSVGYLNARTCADHTSFYLMARVDEEFMECIDLYMDAVLHPLVYKDENIFRREGWRIEIAEDEDDGNQFLQFNGIVLNEMKAKDNDLYSRKYNAFRKKMFPETCYGYRSGGKSYKIPNCSYNDLLDFHKKYYRTANSFIYVFGDFDIEETLKFLDKEYLCKEPFGERFVMPKVANNKQFEIVKHKLKMDRGVDKSYVYGCLFDGKVRPEQALAFDLFEDEISEIIGYELDEKGIVCSIDYTFDNYSYQDVLTIEIITEIPDAGKTIKKCIERALRGEFSSDDRFRAHLMAKLNEYEINFWEQMHFRDSVGKDLFDRVRIYWLYDEKLAFDAFQISDNIQYIKNRMWGACYNTLITQQLPVAGKEIIMEYIPKNKGEFYFLDRLDRRFDSITKDWDEIDYDALDKENEQFYLWESQIDDMKRKRHNKAIKIDDKFNVKYEMPQYKTYNVNNTTIYHILEKQSKVVWLCLSFNADEFREHIAELNLLVSFFNARDFSDFYGLNSGEAKGFLTNYLVAEVVINRDFEKINDTCHIRVDVSTCVLEENIPDVLKLIYRMLFDVFIAVPKYEDTLKWKIDKIIDDFCYEPDEFNCAIAGKDIDDRCYLLDESSGFGYYRTMKALLEGGKNVLENFYLNCYAMLNRIFVNERLSIFCSSTERGLTLVNKSISTYSLTEIRNEIQLNLKKDYNGSIFSTRDYYEREELKYWKKFALKHRNNTELCEVPSEVKENGNSAVIIPSNVNYVALYGVYPGQFDYKKSDIGVLTLAMDLLENIYLRREIRESGGAYGYSAQLYSSGKLCITTYRDPHLKRSIEVIKNSAKFLRELQISENELEEAKVKHLNELTDNAYNDPWEDQENVRNIEIKHMIPNLDEIEIENVRNCTLADIHRVADFVQKCIDNSHFCVFGSKKSITKMKDLFDSIENLAEIVDKTEEEPVV